MWIIGYYTKGQDEELDVLKYMYYNIILSLPSEEIRERLRKDSTRKELKEV